MPLQPAKTGPRHRLHLWETDDPHHCQRLAGFVTQFWLMETHIDSNNSQAVTIPNRWHRQIAAGCLPSSSAAFHHQPSHRHVPWETQHSPSASPYRYVTLAGYNTALTLLQTLNRKDHKDDDYGTSWISLCHQGDLGPSAVLCRCGQVCALNFCISSGKREGDLTVVGKCEQGHLSTRASAQGTLSLSLQPIRG